MILQTCIIPAWVCMLYSWLDLDVQFPSLTNQTLGLVYDFWVNLFVRSVNGTDRALQCQAGGTPYTMTSWAGLSAHMHVLMVLLDNHNKLRSSSPTAMPSTRLTYRKMIATGASMIIDSKLSQCYIAQNTYRLTHLQYAGACTAWAERGIMTHERLLFPSWKLHYSEKMVD